METTWRNFASWAGYNLPKGNEDKICEILTAKGNKEMIERFDAVFDVASGHIRAKATGTRTKLMILKAFLYVYLLEQELTADAIGMARVFAAKEQYSEKILPLLDETFDYMVKDYSRPTSNLLVPR
ncbi:MAG: hypothetical protein ABH829_04880 [archaeon]